MAVRVDEELAREEEGVAEDLVTAVKIAKEKDPPTIHRLSKNEIKLATII